MSLCRAGDLGSARRQPDRASGSRI